jgi:exopolyphosphatase/guanosine-5'-triphosphate,3'-diphosphate pyrophosphatase
VQERIGVIDLGSNTTRLMVMGYTPHHSFRLLDEVRETVRLAEGIGEDGRLQPAPMQRAIDAMKLFNSFCKSTGVSRIVPVATSAVRDATNQSEFLMRVEREAGIKLRVLSTQEEAYYGYVGAINSLNMRDAFLVDIGGGSTEVTAIRGRAFLRSFSAPAGAVRFRDRFIHSDPISKEDFAELVSAAEALFTDVEWLKNTEGTSLFGIGGTIRTLVDIEQKSHNYPLDRVHYYSFTRERLDEIIEMLRGMNQKQREEVPGLSRDRADIILAGAVIIQQLMKVGNFKDVTVSGQGLREGLFYEQFLVGENPPLFDDMRSFSVQNLARNYNYEPIHTTKVRDLSLSLFDQLAPLHGYGRWERELLSYAATLHDIGTVVSYYDHHKHGAYLVVNSASLQGFNHREVLILALLVRYHRKGDVSVKSYQQVLDSSDNIRIARLSAMLRLAEYLERSRSQVIQSIQVEIGDSVRIVTRAIGDATVEIWDANRTAGFFKKAFGKSLEVIAG